MSAELQARVAELEQELAQLRARPTLYGPGSHRTYVFDSRPSCRNLLPEHEISATSEPEARAQLEAKIGKEAAASCKFRGFK